MFGDKLPPVLGPVDSLSIRLVWGRMPICSSGAVRHGGQRFWLQRENRLDPDWESKAVGEESHARDTGGVNLLLGYQGRV